MAALNTVTNLKANITLDGVWNTLTAGGEKTSGFLIMIKQLVKASENIDTDSIQAVTMDVGIDSGEVDQVLTLGSYTFNFAPISFTSVNTINDRAAFTQIQSLPKKFYYRFTAIETSSKVIKVGDKVNGATPVANIKLNIEELVM